MISEQDQKPIIMMTNYENIFLANNSRQKSWTLARLGILQPKQKEKRIMVLNF